MSTLQELLLLWLAFSGVGLVWWADRVMEQADEELSAFAQRGLEAGRLNGQGL